MSPELRWLVDCLQALARDEAPPVPRESIDWAQVLTTAEAEALAPALGFAFKAGPPEDMPPAVAARLHRHLVDATARHVLLSAELGRLLKFFEREDIPVMPLKGPVLAETLYRHPALRPYTDLDLLIPRDAVVRVDDHLHRLGYKRFVDAHSFAFDIAYDRATLYETTSGVRVDLHWGLLSDPRYSWNERDADGIWERALPIRVAGEEALGLCPEDLLLYLTAHLAVHHALAGVLWFYDLYLLLERGADTLDWRAVSERASRWRVRGALYFSLHEVQNLFGARVSLELMAAVQPRGPRAAVMAFLLRSRAPAQRRALEHVIAVLLVDRGRDVLRTLGGVLLPSSDWVQARYGTVATSRFGSYRAHYRRLGQVMRQAARGLRPPRR
jgi:hypothetical protein